MGRLSKTRRRAAMGLAMTASLAMGFALLRFLPVKRAIPSLPDAIAVATAETREGERWFVAEYHPETDRLMRSVMSDRGHGVTSIAELRGSDPFQQMAAWLVSDHYQGLVRNQFLIVGSVEEQRSEFSGIVLRVREWYPIAPIERWSHLQSLAAPADYLTPLDFRW